MLDNQTLKDHSAPAAALQLNQSRAMESHEWRWLNSNQEFITQATTWRAQFAPFTPDYAYLMPNKLIYCDRHLHTSFPLREARTLLMLPSRVPPVVTCGPVLSVLDLEG